MFIQNLCCKQSFHEIFLPVIYSKSFFFASKSKWFHEFLSTYFFRSKYFSCKQVLSQNFFNFYRHRQANPDWLRNVSLTKNPHFPWYQADILAIWPNHEVVILTKFHQNWTKIGNSLLMAHFLASSHSPAHVCRFEVDEKRVEFPYRILKVRQTFFRKVVVIALTETF